MVDANGLAVEEHDCARYTAELAAQVVVWERRAEQSVSMPPAHDYAG
jgi:hypothetical protein